jgi:hypothetical protein
LATASSSASSASVSVSVSVPALENVSVFKREQMIQNI